MVTIAYTLDDYIKIKELGSSYSLPSETIDIINYVSNMVGSPNYVKTPQFLVHDSKKKKRNKNNELNSDDWEAIRNFQTTTKNEKVGIDKTIDSIKGEINKIADKNYDIQKDIIMELIRESILLYNKEDIDKIGNIIIDVSSSNRFFSKLYSNLVVEILKTYDFITPIIQQNYDRLYSSINEINTHDFTTDDDYEALCKVNKNNENRRSKCAFFINLTKKKYMDTILIFNIISVILNKMYDTFQEPDTYILNEELSELLFVVVEEGHDILKLDTKWNDVYTKIEKISEMKSNDKGLTNKIIFKIMDLLDIINIT